MRLLLRRILARTGQCVGAVAIVLGLSLGLSSCASPGANQAEHRFAQAMLCLHTVVGTAFDAYLDGILTGAIPTNSMPEVCRAYNRFQAWFSNTVASAEFGFNTYSNLNWHANELLRLIEQAKTNRWTGTQLPN
ncbi:MAG: hypothetical protein NZ739_08160 [Verrucomicrobiae bacterium]|nr:hypothetical protein [Verrucomicrobiae bacterium]